MWHLHRAMMMIPLKAMIPSLVVSLCVNLFHFLRSAGAGVNRSRSRSSIRSLFTHREKRNESRVSAVSCFSAVRLTLHRLRAENPCSLILLSPFIQTSDRPADLRSADDWTSSGKEYTCAERSVATRDRNEKSFPTVSQ